MRSISYLLFIFVLLLSGCGSKKHGSIQVFNKGNYVYLSNARIELRFDENLYCKVSYRSGDKPLSINDDRHTGNHGVPNHFIMLNRRLYRDFSRTTWDQRDIEDPYLGHGIILTLNGTVGGIIKTLKVEMYDSLPDVAISTCTYTNTTDSVLTIDSVFYNYYRLDRKLTAPDKNSDNFHYVQPLNKQWGRRWSNLTISDSTHENFIIPGTGSNYSGIPFIDVWGAEAGLAVFHVEGKPRFLNIKLDVQADRKVDEGLVTVPGNTFGQFPDRIMPGQSVSTWRSAVCIHTGDFFNSANRFGTLLDAALRSAGKKGFIRIYPDRYYEPYWKTWGMNDLKGSRNFTPDQVYGRMDELADNGFKAIMLDDGWQNCLGLWNPAPDKFAGEKQMIDFVKEAHTQKWGRNKDRSFKVYLWFDLLGTDTITNPIKPLLIKNKDGSVYKSKQAKYAFCPAYEGTRQYIDSLTQKIIKRWDIDGLYTDWEDQNPQPCFDPEHHHDPESESMEDNYLAFREMSDRISAIKPETGWTSQCACAAVHDVYQYPYYYFEDASDATSNEQVRWRVRWIKAIRGSRAPVGDGYVDKMDYNRLAGEPAQSVAIGSVITSVRWKVDELGGEEHARRWMNLYQSENISKGEYLGLYDIAYDKPETYVIRKDNGILYYSFFSKEPFENTVTLRGLETGKTYHGIQYEDDIDLGEINPENPVIRITMKKGHSEGDPVYYYVIKCVPL